ncbi:hypothetical protein Z052_15420 [Halorubrum sp. C191]|nr:hypothetical protein Z052_15420 [Halorubrum sp. C191]
MNVTQFDSVIDNDAVDVDSDPSLCFIPSVILQYNNPFRFELITEVDRHLIFKLDSTFDSRYITHMIITILEG